MNWKGKLERQSVLATSIILLLVLCVCGQTKKQDRPVIKASALPSHERIVIKPDGLPPEFETPSARNFPRVVPQPEGASLKTLPGFEVKVFAEGNFQVPRWIIEGPNGDLFLTDARANNVILLRDQNQDGKIDNATERFVFAQGFNQPFGMAIHEGYFYVANTNSLVRFKYQVGQTKLEGEPEKIIDLPGLGYNQHWTRNIMFRPDGKKLYVTVGSQTNVSEEADPRRAAISEYNPDGSGHRIVASGLRNAIGLAWNPTTGVLWTAVNERDELGDDVPPDYVTSVKDGGFYGWPYSYIGQHEDPRLKGKRSDLVAKAIVPEVLLEAHCAALGLVFYTGPMFPKEYQGDAFVALHGSWNRATRSGYKIIRIPFKNGKPEGGYENFLTGWVIDDASKDVWGRPVGLTMLRDGSLLIVDDGGNKIWRVTYKTAHKT